MFGVLELKCIIFPPGNSGVAVMLYDPRKSAPQPADIAKAAGAEAAETITQISDR